MKKNIIACAESAAAELLEISEDLSLEEMRDRLQEAINLLNEADCDLIKLKEEIYE